MPNRRLMKRGCFAAAVLIAFSALASCGGGEPQTDAPAADAVTTVAEETAAIDPVDAMFTLSQEDNGGETFTILSSVVQSYEFDATEEIGEVVNDAVFARNRAVEELLGIDLTFDYKPGNYEDREQYFNLVSASVMAGDCAYDLVTGMISCMVPYAASGVYSNILDIDTIHSDAPWYVTEMKDVMTIGGKLFCYAGDMSMSMYRDISVVFANLGIINASGCEDPYELVRDGKWTLEAMDRMCRTTGSDLNGDGKMTVADDRFGLLYVGIRGVSLQCAFNINVVGHDGDSLMINPLSERMTNAVERLSALFELDGVYGDNIADFTDYSAAFMGDRVYLYITPLYAAGDFRDMQNDFAILPLPKYDEAQDACRTLMPTSSQIMFVPITADLSMTGKVMEAMNYYSCKMTIPAYYDTALSQKYSRDEDTQEMLALIREGMTLPIDYAYGSTLGGSPQMQRFLFDTAFGGKAGQAASLYEKNVQEWSKKLESLIADYTED